MDSLIGIVGQDFVIMASDTNTGRSIMRMKDDFDKLVELDGHKIMARGGEIGDGDQFCELISRYVSLYKFNHDIELTTDETAHLIRKELANGIRSDPYFVNSLLGGFDTDKGFLYYLDYLGSLQEIKYGAHGYAAYFVSSILDKFYKPDLNQDQAIELIIRCIDELDRRFIIGSIGFVIKIIDKDGIHKIPFERKLKKTILSDSDEVNENMKID
eukprot:Anaeramoba_ignava/a225519_114.p1 GENE.a225519_114~~a225519_114.p1  ORF type:complete len:214 (+),score=47.93 a225519_114:56-697(+)